MRKFSPLKGGVGSTTGFRVAPLDPKIIHRVVEPSEAPEVGALRVLVAGASTSAWVPRAFGLPVPEQKLQMRKRAETVPHFRIPTCNTSLGRPKLFSDLYATGRETAALNALILLVLMNDN